MLYRVIGLWRFFLWQKWFSFISLYLPCRVQWDTLASPTSLSPCEKRVSEETALAHKLYCILQRNTFSPAARERGVYKVLHIFTAILQNDFAKHLKESGKGLQCRILVFIVLKVPCKQLLILGCSLKNGFLFLKKKREREIISYSQFCTPELSP